MQIFHFHQQHLHLISLFQYNKLLLIVSKRYFQAAHLICLSVSVCLSVCLSVY